MVVVIAHLVRDGPGEPTGFWRGITSCVLR